MCISHAPAVLDATTTIATAATVTGPALPHAAWTTGRTAQACRWNEKGSCSVRAHMSPTTMSACMLGMGRRWAAIFLTQSNTLARVAPAPTSATARIALTGRGLSTSRDARWMLARIAESCR